MSRPWQQARPRLSRNALVVVALAILSPAALAGGEGAREQQQQRAAVPNAAVVPNARPIARGSDLASCLKAIEGAPELRLPGSPDYELYGNGLRTMEPHTPAAVLFPDTTPQVQAAVVCATRHGVRPIPRSGGFSFENLGTADGALVIDLSNMAEVVIDAGAMTATADAGVRMGNLYYEIFKQGRAAGGRNLTCLGGTYPQIGFGGILLAGGYGAFTRKFGLLSDSLISAKMVDAKGQLLSVDEESHPDLLFALRGGGGGTYGIVVEATIRLFEIPVVTLARIKYESLEHAVALFDRFQRWGPTSPPELSLKYNLKPDKTDVNIQYMGSKADLDRLIREESGMLFPGGVYEAAECDVQGSRGWTPEGSIIPAGKRGGWKTVSHFLLEPQCMAHEATVVPQRVRPGGPLAFMKEAAQYRSAYFDQPIPLKGLEAIRDVVAAPMPQWRQVLCRVHGPGLSALADGFSAFGNRGQRVVCEYGTSFGMRRTLEQTPKKLADEVWAWFKQARDVMGAYDSGAEYNGWINRFDKPENYFGANYEALKRIEKKYDPDNVFFNALSVVARRRLAERDAEL
ncbi:MAG: hypothetical protein J3K34DRAFT_523261 [Monoraphidium minutum]|nr:MAG: hypothetical protein J3K34DRAFT_523261 [Monoraphidium minutum]